LLYTFASVKQGGSHQYGNSGDQTYYGDFFPVKPKQDPTLTIWLLSTQDKAQSVPEASPAMQQIGMLNLRINDMMTQLNTVMKTLMDENAALKKENTDLKAKQQTSKQ
jgi:hypothetical protein